MEATTGPLSRFIFGLFSLITIVVYFWTIYLIGSSIGRRKGNASKGGFIAISFSFASFAIIGFLAAIAGGVEGAVIISSHPLFAIWSVMIAATRIGNKSTCRWCGSNMNANFSVCPSCGRDIKGMTGQTTVQTPRPNPHPTHTQEHSHKPIHKFTPCPFCGKMLPDEKLKPGMNKCFYCGGDIIVEE